MFSLLALRNIIFLEMRGSDPKLKEAIGGVLNALDSDLTVEGYEPSSELTESLDNLDKVIIELDSSNDNDGAEPIDDEEKASPVKGFRDLGEHKE